jgi:plasmid rolling circle replication initiator protein Rep
MIKTPPCKNKRLNSKNKKKNLLPLMCNLENPAKRAAHTGLRSLQIFTNKVIRPSSPQFRWIHFVTLKLQKNNKIS